MTEPPGVGVRQPAAAFAQTTSSWPIVRDISAPLLRRTDLRSGRVSVEHLQRRGNGPVAWHFQQDRHALFLFEQGVTQCRGTMNGRPIETALTGMARLAFIPAGTRVDATFQVPARCSYLVAFFDAPPLADEDVAEFGIPSPRIGFTQPRLSHAASQLGQELMRQDRLSRLMLEGWAIQAWALLHREQTPPPSAPMLRPAGLRLVLDHMRAHLAEDVTVVDMAGLTGLGVRQFCRRFHASTGVTPSRARDTMRLETAAHLLTTTGRSVTDIAMECGFSQPQHLATALKRHYGRTPTELRS